MPIPKSKDIGKTIDFLKTDKPGWSKGQRLAVALDTARRAGAKIKSKPRKYKKEKK